MSSDESHTSSSEEYELVSKSSHEWKEEFCGILNNVRNPGKFCVSKTLIFPNMLPKIIVRGLDDRIAFPLPRCQAELLRCVAEKAPFGRNLETVLDENVRKAWQIDASMIVFQDKLAWESELSKIVNQMKRNLGSDGSDVQANLYKMLLYETGGHFLRHCDTEKEPGMFATLIIQLPSRFNGGDLVVRHNGEAITVKNSKNCRSRFRVTAFYADCEHTLQVITSGFRLCLVYNLVISSQQNLPNLPTSQLSCEATINATVEKLKKLEVSWNDCLEKPFVGYLLEHKYTSQNLGFNYLKGRDQHVMNLLRCATDADGQSLFVTSLILFEKKVIGPPPEEAQAFHYEDSVYMEEYHLIRVNCLLAPDGSEMDDYDVEIDLIEDFLNAKEENDVFGHEPDDEEYEGYTGNAGPTLEQWYYRAAVMFWPMSNNIDMVELGGLDYLSSYLTRAEEPELSILCERAIRMLNTTNSESTEDLLEGLLRSRKPQLVASGLKFSEVVFGKHSALRNIALKMGDVAEVKEALLNLVSQSVERELKPPYSHYSNSSFHTLTFADSLKGLRDELYNEIHALIISKALSHDSLFKNGGKCVKIALSAFSLPEQFSLFIDRALTSADESLSSKILEALSSVPGVTVNGDVRRLAESKISKLRTSVAEGSPKFSWCQTSATFQGSQADAVNAFLRSDEIEKTFTDFSDINQAKNWANMNFNWNRESYSADATPGGTGGRAFVKLTKTRGAHDKAVAKYENNLSELRKWEKMFNSADSAPTDDIDVNCNACSPDLKRMKIN